MPIGKVKWFNEEKGFGFITSENGQQVFLHSSVLPKEIHELKAGTKLEFGIADGRKGAQALSVRILNKPHPSFTTKIARKSIEDTAIIIEDLIKLLDKISNNLRRRKYPDSITAEKVASLLRAVADDLDN